MKSCVLAYVTVGQMILLHACWYPRGFMTAVDAWERKAQRRANGLSVFLLMIGVLVLWPMMVWKAVASLDAKS